MSVDRVASIVEQWRELRPDLDPSPLLVFGRIQHIAGALDLILRPPFAEAGLGHGEFDVLAALRRAGEPFVLTPGQLAEQMLVTSGAVTKRVDRLIARGLVSRSVAEGDARGRVVSLTEEGRRLVDRLIEQHLANERALLAALSGHDVDRLASLLGKLARAIDAADGAE